MSTPTYQWTGDSGKSYRYEIYVFGTSFRDLAGNYIYAKEAVRGIWRPVYVGQSSSLKDRLADHEKEVCARRNGATHIHAHTTSGGDAVRKMEEADLIARWNPVCNG
jgi:hypothetical protein